MSTASRSTGNGDAPGEERQQRAEPEREGVDPGRRRFLRRSLAVLGTAGAGAAMAGLRAESAPPQDGAAAPGGASHNHDQVTHALTPDGQVVHLHEGKVVRLPVLPGDPAARVGVPSRKWVMVIDLAKCDGCGKCMEACSKMHFVPGDRQWIKVLRMRDAEHTAPYFFPQPCYHCDNPPCTKVCPVDATFKREDGSVLIDNERCIGCRFCMAACPYGARSFNWGHPQDPPQAIGEPYSPEQGFPRRVGTVEKCDFCTDMAAQGLLPACTSGCPMAAIYYGDQNEDAVTNSKGETLRLSRLVLDNSGYRHLEELGTKPRVYYLPPKNRVFAAPAYEPSVTAEQKEGVK
jgi:molybdopterin-containing oxidoreductase family iron-sulfur binding subunit